MTSLGYYPQMILFSYKGGEGGGEFYKTHSVLRMPSLGRSPCYLIGLLMQCHFNLRAGFVSLHSKL